MTMLNRVGRAVSRAVMMGGGSSDNEDSISHEPNSSMNSHHWYSDPLDDPSSNLNKFLDTSKPMGKSGALFYSLELQPFKIRRERVVMVAEAYAIFGALFLNGVWFIWEYGTSAEFENDMLRYTFEVICAISIICNTFLALFGCFLWICVLWFADFHDLQFASFISTSIVLGIAIFNRLQENLVAAIFIPVFMALLFFRLVYQGCHLFGDQLPLEMLHMPFYFKDLTMYRIVSRLAKKNRKETATERSEFLRQLAAEERAPKDSIGDSGDDLKSLLIEAAEMLGRSDADVRPYLIKLKEAWYDDVASLEGKSADALSKYMPDRLAECVCRLLQRDATSAEQKQA